MAKLVRGIIREDRMMAVIAALEQAGVTGMTVTNASGRGRHTALGSYRGVKYRMLLPIFIVEVITSEAAADEVVRIILEHAHTGEHGDGHVMVIPVEECYAVRTRWRAVA